MDPKKNNNYSISYSWKQSHVNWPMPTVPSKSVEAELAVLDAIDKLVTAGLTSREADAIINGLTKKG